MNLGKGVLNHKYSKILIKYYYYLNITILKYYYSLSNSFLYK